MYNCTIQGINLNDVYYSLMHREDDDQLLDWAFEILDDIDCEATEFPEEAYEEDELAEILSVLKAYARGYLEMSDVVSILSDEYPWVSWPWDNKYWVKYTRERRQQ